MVHRVYICSNLNSHFAMLQYDQFEGCNIYNNVMWRNPSFVIKKQVKFQEGEQCLLLPTISPPTILKQRMVCCQEGEDDEDMTPSDMTTDYLLSSFRHLYSNFWYNSLGSICTCLYLIEGTIVFQSTSSSKFNIRFVGSPTMLLHPWDPGPSRSMPQGRGEHLRDSPGRPPP